MGINTLCESTQIYSDKTRMSLNSQIQKLDGVGILNCPTYIFVVGNDSSKSFIIDSHAIPKTLGESNNDIIVTIMLLYCYFNPFT